MSESSAATIREPSKKEIRLVVAASSAGTVFEWYDFFIYGTLAALIGPVFFPSGNAVLETLLVWATFAVGFGFRPLGAILFGFLGDRLGRKYTFLVTVTLMGIATAGVGMIPSAETIGIAAPIIVILLRILQGLALGGEYGGATTYVSEHTSPERRGYFTSYVQASVVGGFVLSIAMVLLCRTLIPAEDFAAWGWRIPFLVSILLLVVSLWMRLKLNESPVFQAMKAEQKISKNPFVESFTYPGNKKRIFVALFGVTACLTTIFYSAFFSSLSFLRGPMRVEPTTVEVLVLISGNILTLFTIFPAFWMLGGLANPGLIESSRAAPVTISGPQCDYDPFSDNQATQCGRLIEDLTAEGVPYDTGEAEFLTLTAGDTVLTLGAYAWDDGPVRREQLREMLSTVGYDFSVQDPPILNKLGIIVVLLWFGVLSALTYGSVAALLSEMFPARIRYSSMSIPYHIGAGYFGGFLPVIAGYIVAKSGDVYSGLWYTWGFVFVALIVGWWGLPDGPPKDFEDNHEPV